MRTWFSIWLVFFCLLSAQAQKKVLVSYDLPPRSTIIEFTDSFSLIAFLSEKQRADFAQGYLYARFTCSLWSDSVPEAKYYTGRKVVLKSVAQGNADENVLRSIGFNERKIKKWTSPDPAQILLWENNLVTYYEDNGCPFAAVSFQVDRLENDTVHASWSINPGPMIVFDSLIQKGKYKPGTGYLSTWLGIEQGNPYDESKLLLARKRILSSDIVDEEKPLQLHFSEGKARVYFYLKRKKANRFDGIVGFAPDAVKAGKINFTGEVNLKLANSFNHGDVISLMWKSGANHSQELTMKAGVPYLIGLPAGINVGIEMYKRDTLYVRTKQRYGITYFTGVSTRIEFFGEKTENRVLDKSIYEHASSLPSWADSRATAGGISLILPKVDNLIVPGKGYLIETEWSIGKKKILKNAAAEDSLYNNITLESAQWSNITTAQVYVPVKGAFKLMGSARAGWLESKSVFENDLFLLGGLSLLRGFDEKSIPVSKYLVSSVEARFFIEKYSYLVLFTDYAAVKEMQNGVFENQFYLSVGTGLSFSTNAGVFNIFYALGKSNPGDFRIRNGKIHFGFVTRF